VEGYEGPGIIWVAVLLKVNLPVAWRGGHLVI